MTPCTRAQYTFFTLRDRHCSERRAAALDVLREKDDSGHGPVQAVHQPQEHLAWFSVFPFDIFPGHIHEGRLSGAVPLNQDPRRFDHGDEMVVLV